MCTSQNGTKNSNTVSIQFPSKLYDHSYEHTKKLKIIMTIFKFHLLFLSCLYQECGRSVMPFTSVLFTFYHCEKNTLDNQWMRKKYLLCLTVSEVSICGLLASLALYLRQGSTSWQEFTTAENFCSALSGQ